MHMPELERPSSCSCLKVPTTLCIFRVALCRFTSRFQMTRTIICNNHRTQALLRRVGKLDLRPPRFQNEGSAPVQCTVFRVFSVQGVPKKCHDFNRMPFRQLLTEPIALTTPCSKHLSILIDKNLS